MSTKPTNVVKGQAASKSAIQTVEISSRKLGVQIASNPNSSVTDRAAFSERLVRDAQQRAERSFRGLAFANKG